MKHKFGKYFGMKNIFNPIVSSMQISTALSS